MNIKRAEKRKGYGFILKYKNHVALVTIEYEDYGEMQPDWLRIKRKELQKEFEKAIDEKK